MRPTFIATLALTLGVIGCGPSLVSEEETVFSSSGWKPVSGWDPAWSLDHQRVVERQYSDGTTDFESFSVDADDVRVRAASDSGAEVDFVRLDIAPTIWLPERPVGPGTWRLEVTVEGELSETLGDVEVGEYGQVDGFDVEQLNGARFTIDSARVAPDLMDALLEAVASRLVVAIDREQEAWNARIFVPIEDGGLCRVWTGEVDVDDRGGLSVDEPSLTIEEGLQGTLTDVAMRLRFDGAAESAGGFELAATFDTREFNAVMDSEEEGPAEEGALREQLEEFGVNVQACADGEVECARFRSFAGSGERGLDRWTEGDLEEAGRCGGAASGSGEILGLSCSVVGTSGVGVGMIGLLALLFRRRRMERA